MERDYIFHRDSLRKGWRNGTKINNPRTGDSVSCETGKLPVRDQTRRGQNGIGRKEPAPVGARVMLLVGARISYSGWRST